MTVMIPTVVFSVERSLRIHRPTKLATPDDERVIEHAFGFQVLQ